MSWLTTYSGTCDYTDTAGYVGLVGTMHRSATTLPPPLWCRLPFEHVASVYCTHEEEVETGTWRWSLPMTDPADTRYVGLRDGRWYRQLYKVESKWIARAHKVYFRRCRLFHHRIVSSDDTAYSGKLWLLVSDVEPPTAVESVAQWNACASGHRTVWRAHYMENVGGGAPETWQTAFGKYDVRPMSVYTPAYAILEGGEDNHDAESGVDLLQWSELIRLDESADAYFAVDLDWFHAWKNDQPSAGRPHVEIGADPAQASPFYVELDREFDPSWILGRDAGEDSIATS